MKKTRLTVLTAVALVVLGSAVWTYWDKDDGYPGPMEKITIAHRVTPNSAMVHLAFTDGLFAERDLDAVKPGSVGVIR